ncbi:MAG: type II TA system antitoxin MqsA family protein [Bacteroidota bacterium]
MKSPVTGKEMPLKKEDRTMTFRKEEFEVLYHYYICEGSGEQFTDTKLDEVNLNQLYNQYRAKYHLPFPDEIISIRKKYGVPANKMAEILGFGVNVYRNYENGEIPSESNARLMQLANDPEEFEKLLKLSKVYSRTELSKVIDRTHELKQKERIQFVLDFEEYAMGEKLPDEFTGYRMPHLNKMIEMVVFFTQEMKPWKTKLNKLLFYADFLHFKNTCFSISGSRYHALQMGPVVKNFSSIFEYAANKDEVDIHQTLFADGGIGEQFVPRANRPFRSALFEESELSVLQTVAENFKRTKTVEIIDISHKEPAWIKNEKDHQLISYKHGFELQTI